MSQRPAPPPSPVTVLRGHLSGVQAVCFLNDNVLLSGSQDGVVKVWNLERRRACAELTTTSNGTGVQRLDRIGRRGRVVSQGRDMLIKVWDAERFGGGGRGSGGGRTGASGPTTSPEPLQVLATGSFHFCQFALTRWRDSPETEGAGENVASSRCSSSSSSRKESSKVGGTSGGDGRGDSDPSGPGELERREDDLGEERGEQRGREDADLDDERGERAGDALAMGVSVATTPKTSPSSLEARGERGGGGGGEGGGGGGGGRGSFLSNDSSFAENVMLAPSMDQHSMSLWDLRDGRPSFSFSPRDAERKGMVMCVRLLGESPSCASPFAVVGHDSGHLCAYDLRATSAEPLLESQLHTAPLLCVDVGSCCRQGVSGSADESINVFRLSTRKASCQVIKTFHVDHPGTSCVEIRRDQKLFVSGGWDHRVRVFGWKTPRPLAVLRTHEKNVHAVAYSPRIGGVASGSGDSRVAVWDLFPDKKRGGVEGGRDDSTEHDLK